MKDFWFSCGHHLLDRDPGGGLLITDEFLKAYLVRPEIVPPDDACAAERGLHAALMHDPRWSVGRQEIASIVDEDARENWTHFIQFRDLLLRYPTLEAAYLSLIRGEASGVPPLFVNQLVHVILRNALDGCEDAFRLRAAELFFRPQRLTSHEGSLLAADEERIAGSRPTPVSPLVSMLGLEASAEIDVLSEANAESYFVRSDQFDMALDMTAGRRGQTALAKVIATWLRHLLAVNAEVDPFIEVKNANFSWYVGLDAEGTRIGDRLWNGDAIEDEERQRIVALYMLRLVDRNFVIPEIGAEPIYLIMAMTRDRVLRLKPQNLVTGLPLRNREAVS